jgi:hypothetical protein
MLSLVGKQRGVMGWSPEEAIGKSIFVEKHSWRTFGTNAEVIGVIEDHRYSPLYKQSTLAMPIAELC